MGKKRYIIKYRTNTKTHFALLQSLVCVGFEPILIPQRQEVNILLRTHQQTKQRNAIDHVAHKVTNVYRNQLHLHPGMSVTSASRDVRLGRQVCQIATKWDKSLTFINQRSVFCLFWSPSSVYVWSRCTLHKLFAIQQLGISPPVT